VGCHAQRPRRPVVIRQGRFGSSQGGRLTCWRRGDICRRLARTAGGRCPGCWRGIGISRGAVRARGRGITDRRSGGGTAHPGDIPISRSLLSACWGRSMQLLPRGWCCMVRLSRPSSAVVAWFLHGRGFLPRHVGPDPAGRWTGFSRRAPRSAWPTWGARRLALFSTSSQGCPQLRGAASRRSHLCRATASLLAGGALREIGGHLILDRGGHGAPQGGCRNSPGTRHLEPERSQSLLH
jgi:hypothetical protein